MGITNKGSQYISIPQGCLEFEDANYTYVKVARTSDLEPTDKITVSAWVTTEDQSIGNSIVSQNGNYEIIMGISDKYSFTLNKTNSTAINTELKDGKWHHLVGTYDSSLGSDNAKLYVDGVVDGTLTYSSPLTYDGDILCFGGRTSGNRLWDGKICDVRVYSGSCLDTDEVKQLYNGTYNTTTNLVGHWKFDDREGTSLTDSTSYSHNGILVSGPTWTDRNIRCWGTRWDEGNWDVTVETFVDACDRNYLFENIIPGAVRELYNILGTPCYIDTTYESSNTLIMTPISDYGLSGLRRERMIGVKSISDTFINKDYFNVKIEGYRLDI